MDRQDGANVCPKDVEPRCHVEGVVLKLLKLRGHHVGPELESAEVRRDPASRVQDVAHIPELGDGFVGGELRDFGWRGAMEWENRHDLCFSGVYFQAGLRS